MPPIPLKGQFLNGRLDHVESKRERERERIRNYKYMSNHLQQGAEIYKRHLEMKAKSQQ